MLARFFIVLFVELAHQFFEYRAHGMVVDARWREVDRGVEKHRHQRAERVGLREGGQLVAKLEVVEDVLNIGRESVQIVLKISKKLLLVASRLQIAQRELGRVVEGLARGSAKGSPLLGDQGPVEHRLGFKHLLLRGLQHRIHAPDHAHRQDHVGILAAPEQVAQHVVCDTPDEGDDLVVGCLIHQLFIFCMVFRLWWVGQGLCGILLGCGSWHNLRW